MDKRLLIIRPDGIGDFVLFSGYLKYFREIYPNYRITIACEPSIISLLKCCPWVDEVFPTIERKKQSRKYLFRWIINLLRLIGIKYDVVLYPCYTRSFLGDFMSIGMRSDFKIAFNSMDKNKGLNWRLFRNKFFDLLIDSSSDLKWEWERERELIEKLGYKGKISGSPEYWICSTDEKNVNDIKAKNKLGLKEYVIISVGSGIHINQWDPLKWVKLIESILSENMFLLCVFSGSSSERRKIYSIINSLSNEFISRCINLAGKINLREFVLIAKDSLLFIGLDSGAAHLAVMAETNVVVITGGGQFGRFFPYKNIKLKVTPRIVFRHLDCFNCEWNCPYEIPPCLSQISVEDVLQEVHKII